MEIDTVERWEEKFGNGTTINGTNLFINGTMISPILANPNINITEMLHQSGKEFSHEEPLFVLILVSVCYAVIFIAGILGNLITCLVIYRNKSMHTATNFYLFNLAISDLTLLLLGKHV